MSNIQIGLSTAAIGIVVVFVGLIILILMVQLFQWAGMRIARALDRRNS